MMCSEPEEVDQFTSRIDFRLHDRLRLTDHRGRIQLRPILAGAQVGGARKYCRSISEISVVSSGSGESEHQLQRHTIPSIPCRNARLNRVINLFFGCPRKLRDFVCMIVWLK
jgi:hypothetical protein